MNHLGKHIPKLVQDVHEETTKTEEGNERTITQKRDIPCS